MGIDRINNALHQAIYVHVGEHYLYVWHGGAYVNIYDQYFNAVDCFDCSSNDGSISLNKVKLLIEKNNQNSIDFYNKGEIKA